MLFLLKLICCIGGTVIIAGGATAFMNWWDKRPIKEEKEPPTYITRTYQEIKDSYDN